MKALFVANLDLNENEGIFKKICAQAEAIGKVIGKCDLITLKGKYANVKKYDNSICEIKDMFFLSYIKDELLSRRVDFMYIRHMIPSIELISILKLAKKNGIKVYYEIPTYPYFAEQFRTSRRKYRAIAKISLDILFWPWIYKYIDKLIVIRSNTKTKLYSKMIEITNGVMTKDIVSKTYEYCDSGVFRMVTVGTLYPYHGYDRILKGLVKCNEKIGNTLIEFHVVGMSKTIVDLKRDAEALGLSHVIFHGVKSTQELNELYEIFDVGLGCLALHRRNANIDTTLKLVEYYCRGIPVVTSGISPMDQINEDFTIHVTDNEEFIDIYELYHSFVKIPIGEKKKIATFARNNFSWDNIMNKLLINSSLN